MGFDAGHQGGAFCVGERLRGVEGGADPGVVGIEGGVIGENDMLVGADLGRVTRRALLSAGSGERTKGAEVNGVIVKRAVFEDLLRDGALSGLSV
jgi:hypothetical protein